MIFVALVRADLAGCRVLFVIFSPDTIGGLSILKIDLKDVTASIISAQVRVVLFYTC